MGHIVVIYGYTCNNGQMILKIRDSWPPESGTTYTMSYNDFVDGQQYGKSIKKYDYKKNGTYVKYQGIPSVIFSLTLTDYNKENPDFETHFVEYVIIKI